jgi:hypothetical protein
VKPILTISLLVAIAIIAFFIWRDSQDTEGIDRNLLQAVKGNKALAKRLLNHARERYPGKSERWYAENVIYDLERDGAGRGGTRFELQARSKRTSREHFPGKRFYLVS